MAALVALAVALGWVLVRPADAGDVRISVGAPPSRLPGAPVHGSIIPRGQGSIIPRGEHDGRVDHGKPHPGRRHHVAPYPVLPQTVYVVPRQCVAPGYWAYQWVPIYQASAVYVPGQWGPDGSWLEAHYESRTVTSGLWQPYWVPEQQYAC